MWRGEQLLLWGAPSSWLIVAAGGSKAPPRSRCGSCRSPGSLVGVGARPSLRWRHWRWEVRPEAVDIRRGTFVVPRTLVPMLRVQHVDTTRGVIEQSLGLATVVFHTAAGATGSRC